ncbi:PAS domain-containing sensor histidine kinase [Snodgrassella communis]|uniref:sensor histidine kinase n=1 Tax=Snodgrassella communis TaxID=2946699 RepID=UPI00055E89EC|nr:ATP-binding protein [Snodgrassella communis]PIT10536.1 PAS domain-containing sensor histidine kinase [Snodgrassella communis]PIT25928.1 PAS domain-containing sensor histidine kinase [Snodgrassella communis]PIT30647.1 PAS domain-containing sensor histidine kinase [Snodgrassella communis]PIT34891.1 PAS domain-containing sensor histidine kinase [Snodgrassella communis]
MRRLILVMTVLCVVTLYVLAVATGNTSVLSQYFWFAFGFASLLVLTLVLMAGSYWWKLLQSRHRHEFGSKIAMRLAAMFTLVAVLPGLFLFGVSAQFISHSIHSWFGNDTEEALNRSISLSKSALDYELDNSVRRAANIQIALIAANSLEEPLLPVLESNDKNKQFSQLNIRNLSNNQLIAEYNPQHLPTPELNDNLIQNLHTTGSVHEIENINNILYAQGWLILPGRTHDNALFFRQPIPAKVAQDATLIEAARAKYGELSFTKKSLQTFFLATLLMATLLAIVLALLVALLFARQFVAPILSLADGARAVAKGDLDIQQTIYRNDELGQLTSLFNHMTVQLRHSREQQEAARHYLEHILNSLTTGVVTLNQEKCLITFNQMAENIFGQNLNPILGQNINQLSEQDPQVAMLADVFQQILVTENQNKPAQITYNHKDETLILLGKATPLPEDSGGGTVLVFDDVTALVSAQKEAAWGEVAQRLAHEIRNPLTPIQLSAERLAWKLHDKLNKADAQILNRATNTIIRQVAAMKDMVETFRNYSRAPALKFTNLDLNELIREVLVLYESSNCTFAVNLSKIVMNVNADSGALRQVIHNLLKNAVEAATADSSPEVSILTELNNEHILFYVNNNGKTFSQEMLLHAFDPYVTDKPGGTGLGLPVVKKIIEEHGGRIQISNQKNGLACVKITLPLQVNRNAKQ